MKRSSKDAGAETDQAMAKSRARRNAAPKAVKADTEAKAATEAGVATEARAATDRTGARYVKVQILGSRRYRGQRDLVNALLEDGKQYSLEEVDGLLEEYLKGRVM